MVAPRAFLNWVGLNIPSFNARLIHFFRIFLHSRDISVELLRESTSYFGYNPRRCFDASCSVVRLEHKKQELLGQIRDIENTSRIMQALQSYGTNADALSHTIFQISPSDDKRDLATCHYDAVSRWVFDAVLNVCETREVDAAASLYHQLSANPSAASFRGHIFERQVLNSLDGIHTKHPCSIRRLVDSNEMTWTYHGDEITRVTYETSMAQAGYHTLEHLEQLQ
jgi:hypothetical protein